MNTMLLKPEVLDYLKLHEQTPLHSFILKGSPFKEISVQELAQQLEGKRKAKGKLPLWHETDGILFPPKLNLEQTSSQATARYKASLMEGNHIVDGTGGFGIDAFYFAQIAKHVTHIEMNGELSAFAKNNAQTLQQSNIDFIVGDSIEFFSKTEQKFDTIFLDPGRRTDAKGKVFMLKDCLPNVPLYKNLLLSKCDSLWIKTAPLLDISAGLEELQYVAEIHIVALKNEVKEILWKLSSKKMSIPQVTVVNLDSEDPILEFDYTAIFESTPTYAAPQKYLYEPNAALMKSGAFHWVCDHFKVDKLHEHSHLYTSAELKDFAGRRFEILEVLPYSKKVAKELQINKANITTRNFPMKVEDIRKKLKIKDGGSVYLFFTTLENSELVVIKTSKI
ncbi:THUMP-like domain-containing protein [Dokdonia sp. Asnod1-B02]|uniref:THUMP-like domain-containing protein n=1 Tax=Dokdonia sp. Asnod1-B02 TaxID=3160573 RepID=UPI003867C096